jgi:endonuclease G, mitochondrial
VSILDPSLLSAAALRYKERVGVPTAESVNVAPAEPSERSNYLSRKLSKERAQLFSIEAAAKGEPQRPDQTVQQIARERIVGSSDLVDINFLELAISMGRAVARIKLGAELGSGVLVGPGLIMTNHHVLESAADASSAIAQFDYQENAQHDMLPVHQFRLNPARFFLTDPVLDFTIVSVEPSSDKGKSLTEYPWIQMIGQTGKAEPGDPINIIQHPNGGLKQIAFRENRIIDIPREVRDFLYYTTDTEPGSSGSPCFNDQWELIALHHSGVPNTDAAGNILKRDKSVWRKGVDPEALIEWIANEGARTSAIVAALQAATLQTEAADLRSKMLGAAPPNPVELARKNLLASPSTTEISFPSSPTAPNPSTVKGVNSMGQSVTLTVPLQITFSIGDAPIPTPVVVAIPGVVTTPPQEAVSDGGQEVTIDPDWSKRKGYDPNFLGIKVALPKLSAAQLANTVEVPPQFRAPGDNNLLRYYHYSVKMNTRRRSAWFSAGMIDGTHFIDFKRGKDKWFLDTRIDSKFQMGEELYVGANTDRGHLTRFKDLSWGANMAEAVNGTNDSFHFTNCTLQLSGFNQGKDRWQGLELYLLENHAKADQRKMIVITGPVFKSSDPKYKNPSMDYTAQIPLAFWKICVLKRKDDSMAATAFTLGQEDIASLPGFEEKFDISTAQVTVADLESTTGLDFGDLKKHDVFAATGDPGALEAFRPGAAKTKVKPIEDYEQIVIE